MVPGAVTHKHPIPCFFWVMDLLCCRSPVNWLEILLAGVKRNRASPGDDMSAYVREGRVLPIRRERAPVRLDVTVTFREWTGDF